MAYKTASILAGRHQWFYIFSIATLGTSTSQNEATRPTARCVGYASMPLDDNRTSGCYGTPSSVLCSPHFCTAHSSANSARHPSSPKWSPDTASQTSDRCISDRKQLRGGSCDDGHAPCHLSSGVAGGGTTLFWKPRTH